MFSMKKSLSLLRLLTAAILLSASGGCSETNDPDPEGGGDPPVKEPVTYTIALGETSEQGAAVKVTPSDETATYYCGIHSEASLLGIPTATLLRQIASLDDLDERLHTGTEEFTIAETLTPVTSYKIVVAGYDGKEFTGDIALSEAFAVEPPAGPAAFTFEVKEKSFDNTVIDITPLAAEVPYFAEVKEAAVCDAMTDDAIISEILNLYGSMAEWFTYTGPTTITSSGDFGTLVPGTDYYVLAFGYADGAAATELTKHKFTTDPEGDPTANTFAFDISGVTARSASIQVEPSDKSVRYIWDIVTDAEYKKYGGNAEGIRSYLADYIKGQIDDFFTTPEEVVSVIGVRGDQWFDYEQLKPATTYYVWAACVDAAGNATATPAVSPAFTTEAAVVSTATATVEFEKYYNGSELYAIDDVTYKNYNNKAYLPAKVVHSADAVKWYTLYTVTDVGDTELYTDDLLIQYLVTQGTPDGEERRYGLTWNAKAYILAVAQDAEGHYGPVFRKSITPSLSGVSPISDLGFVTADAGTQSTPVMLRAVTPAAPLKRTAHVVR